MMTFARTVLPLPELPKMPIWRSKMVKGSSTLLVESFAFVPMYRDIKASPIDLD
jgi:hypothetical protein